MEKANPDLVARDKDGKPYSVRYEAVNAMLLNEFLKEHRKVQQLEANAARQQKQIETLTAGLQKVSAQLELRKVAPLDAHNRPFPNNLVLILRLAKPRRMSMRPHGQITSFVGIPDRPARRGRG